jgi:hypothetical protein
MPACDCNIFHDASIGTDNHVIWAFSYADEAARLAATGWVRFPGDPEAPFTANDIGKVAKQEDNQTYWVLIGIGPTTWREITNGSDIVHVFTIAPSATEETHRLPLANFCAIKYIICAFNNSEGKYKSFEILASRKTGTAVEHNLYSKIGSIIATAVDFDIDGTDAVLTIKNNETYSITVHLTRKVL